MTAEPAPSSVAKSRILWMIALALIIRVLVVAFLVGDQLDPRRDHWKFGWETGRIARSLASGHGFASPLHGDTGPTAWMAPLYPLLLAGVFKLFGIYSAASAWVILSINSLFSALTCLPIVRAAEMSWGQRAARAAGWTWVFFPYAIYLPAGRVWSHSLDALLLARLFALSLRLAQRPAVGAWATYGLVWGIAALTNPALLATLPFLLGWIVWRTGWHKSSSLAYASLTLLLLLLVVSPWFIRNYNTFHRFIPFRDNFWLAFYEGNTGDTSDLYPDWADPSTSPNEMAELQRVGELAYMAEKRDVALSVVKQHPGLFVWTSVRRVGFMWAGFWSLSSPYADGEPFQIPNTLFCSAITLGMLIGLRRAWTRDRIGALPYALVILIFPALYYITHPGIEYRHPIDPLIACLLGLALSTWWEHRRARRATKIADQSLAYERAA